MDFDLLPQLLIIFSIAGILFIVGRNFSKVKEASREEIFHKESEKEKEEKEKFLYLYKRAVRRINKENYQKKMADFWVWLEKLLRRLRIIVLKLDSRMSAILERLRKKNIQSIENLKEMAETAEKNVRKSKEMEGLSEFLSGKGAHNNRWKAKESRSVALEEKKEEDPSVLSDDVAFHAPEVKNLDSYGLPVSDAEKQEEAIAQADYIEIVEVATIESENADEVLSEEIITEEEPEIKSEIEPYEKVMSEVSKIDKEEADVAESVEEEKIRTKKEQECIEILMQDPADIKAYWRLGIIYSKRRNYEDALACFRQIVKIDPTYTKAKQKAIELMEKMKKRGK